MTQPIEPTTYGYMLDHLWATPNGENTARRTEWAPGLYISIRPCTDAEPPTELSEGANHWIFFIDASGDLENHEYEPVASDLTTSTWELYEEVL